MKKQKGITLVALVISIIILLILAGISIQALTNQGIFGRANEAKRESEIANIKEQIALDIYEKQLEPPLGSITEEQLEEILGKYGTVNKEDGTIVGITTEKGYEILLKDIYGGGTVAESVPDGATVTPVNDITTWLKTAGISKQYSYTTIEQVIADSTCIQSLMKNENAMKYLARSTEFANAICASETTMTALGKSAYVDDTVLNSDIWKQSIKASQYWTLVYDSKTVTVYGAASETITIEGYYNGSFTTGTDGSCSHVVPIDTITLTGSVSEQSFVRTVTTDTTEVKVMPEGALYWYGNECSWITGGFSSNNSYGSMLYTIKDIELSKFNTITINWDYSGSIEETRVALGNNTEIGVPASSWACSYDIKTVGSVTKVLENKITSKVIIGSVTGGDPGLGAYKYTNYLYATSGNSSITRQVKVYEIYLGK